MYKVGSIREVEFIGWKDKKSRAFRAWKDKRSWFYSLEGYLKLVWGWKDERSWVHI